LEECLCGVVVLVEEPEPPLLPPQPLAAMLLASSATVASIAVSVLLLIGRAPFIAWLGGPPYQAFL